MTIKGWLSGLGLYAAAVALCLTALCLVMELWRADLRTPFKNKGDAIESQVYTANALASGWYFRNDRLNAPYGMDYRDYPTAFTLHLALAQVIGLFTRNIYLVCNIFFFLTFVLTTLTSLYVFRHFGLARLPALAGSLLYAFLRYHFCPGERHLYLVAYYMVPLTAQVALWLYLGRLAPGGGGAGGAKPAIPWGRWLFAVAVCLLVSGAGIYYAFFGTFFLLVAGLGCAGRERQLGPLLRSVALAGTVCLGLGVNLLPCYLYRWEEGPNPRASADHRRSSAAEVYGLKPVQLVLPVSGHRVRFLRQLKEDYHDDPGRPINYDFYNGLGAVGTAGCVLLVAALLLRPRSPEGSLLSAGLGLFFLSGLLLATVGGLGSLFAFLVSAKIRCYNRLSIYLAFFAFFGVAWALNALVVRARGASRGSRLAVNGLCLLVGAGGLWEETVPADVREYVRLKAENKALAEFTARIEATLPPGSMVLQLPCWPFEDLPASYGMSCTDHFRLYLHSRTLRWSHGGCPGRYGQFVLTDLTDRPVPGALARAVEIGYRGIHIDRWGYADGGHALEARLRELLGGEPIVSRDERHLFFDIRRYAERYRRQFTDAEWARRADEARFPPCVCAGEGCAAGCRDDRPWELLCSPRGQLRVLNPSAESRRVTLRPWARTVGAGPARLVLSGPLLEEVLTIDRQPRTFTLTLDVPPGKHVISFACDAPVRSVQQRRGAFLLSDLAVVPEGPAEGGPTASADERSLNWGAAPVP